jgi:hypothetical protein
MKTLPLKFSLIILFAVALAVAANSSLLKAADYKPGTNDQPEKTFKVKPGGLVSIDADLADGKIETGDYGTVRVQVMSYFKVETPEEVEELSQKVSVEMLQTENTVKVIVKFADDPKQTNREKAHLDFKVYMPRKFNLDMRTGGSARVDDVDGTVKASTLGGSLTVGNVTGALTATSKGGSLTIGNVDGDLEARCEGGSATIGKVAGRVVASTEGGSISIKEAAVALEATATAGSVTAYLPKTPLSDCKITANAGGIDLRLASSVAVTIDAACTAGSVMSDFAIAVKKGGSNRNELKGDMNGGGPVLVLRATAGSIHLNK